MNLIVEVRGSRCTDAGAELVQFIRARDCWKSWSCLGLESSECVDQMQQRNKQFPLFNVYLNFKCNVYVV